MDIFSSLVKNERINIPILMLFAAIPAPVLFAMGYLILNIHHDDILLAATVAFVGLSTLAFALPVVLQQSAQKREHKLRDDIRVLRLQYNSGLSTMHLGFCMFDSRGNIIFANTRYSTIYHLAPDTAAPGLNLHDIVESRIKGGCYIGHDPEAYREEVIKQRGELVGAANVHQLNDGRYIEVRDQATIDGGWISCQEIVTSRIESRKRLIKQNNLFSTALSNVPMGICLYDSNQILTVSNHRYAEIYKIPLGFIKPGISLKEVVELRLELGSVDTQFTSMNNGDEYFELSHKEATTQIHQIKEDIFIEVNIHPLPDGGWLAIHEDVSLRVNAGSSPRLKLLRNQVAKK